MIDLSGAERFRGAGLLQVVLEVRFHLQKLLLVVTGLLRATLL